jgi:hypothetical protein
VSRVGSIRKVTDVVHNGAHTGKRQLRQKEAAMNRDTTQQDNNDDTNMTDEELLREELGDTAQEDSTTDEY